MSVWKTQNWSFAVSPLPPLSLLPFEAGSTCSGRTNACSLRGQSAFRQVHPALQDMLGVTLEGHPYPFWPLI